MTGRNTDEIRLYFREWREWADLTQEQLAAKMGVSHVTVHRHETGKRKRLDLFYLARFTAAIGCPNSWDPLAGPPGGVLPSCYRLLRDLKPAMQEHMRRVMESARDVDL